MKKNYVKILLFLIVIINCCVIACSKNLLDNEDTNTTSGTTITKTFTIQYNSNGGTGSNSPQSISSGNIVTLSDGSGFTKSGYQIKEWNTKNDGSGLTYSLGASVSFTSDITLYAIWITNLRALITEAQFNTLTPHKNYYATDAARYWGDVGNIALFNYEHLEAAALKFPKFLGEGDKTTRLKELAAFFANTSHETTGGWGDNYDDYTYTNTRYGYGYCFPRELDVLTAANTYYGNYANYQTFGGGYSAVSGQYYYGRGPIQTSYPYNYGPLSNDYYGETDGHTLLNNPNLILQTGELFWYAAIRFWMSPSGVKPSCHGSMIDNWDSETNISVAKRNANNLTMGFGLTVNIINGGLEAGNKTTNTFFKSLSDTYYQTYLKKVKDRQGFYKTFCTYMGISYSNDNLDCGSMYPFNQLIEP